jgi:glycosyltransferase involved in cell wall biosynthesis
MAVQLGVTEPTSPHLFGVHVAHGFSSEVAVFARLLGARPDTYAATVLFHENGGERADSRRFADTARCEVVPFDTGWRPNPGASRLTPSRYAVVANYLLRTPLVLNVARRHRPTVVYSSQQHYDCRATTLVSKTLRVPQIVHLHYNIGPWLQRPVLERLMTCDHVVVISDFIRDQALRHGIRDDRVTTIRNTIEVAEPPPNDAGAAVRRELGVPDDGYLIGMIGRLDPEKGQVDAIDAFAALAARRDDVWFVIAGRGHDEARIRAHAGESGAADRIVFAGFRSDVPALLASFDCFLHPSRQEPFGLAVLEAMAAGVPVVAYDEGGVPEIITSGHDGLLAPPGDIGALTDALAQLYEDRSWARSIGEHARTTVATSFRPADAGLSFAEVVRHVSG